VAVRPRSLPRSATAFAAGPARAPTRVLIADADAPTRAGVRQALERAGMVICAEVGNAAAAVEMARRKRPEICLIGVQMPGNGISAAATISFELPQTPVVMLTAAPNDEELFAALRAGAVGYLQKDTDSRRGSHMPCAVFSKARRRCRARLRRG
jgi:DNA-binding NarL/FixJ family response regulator